MFDGIQLIPSLRKAVTLIDFADFETETTEWFVKSFHRFNSLEYLAGTTNLSDVIFTLDGSVMLDFEGEKSKANLLNSETKDPFQSWVVPTRSPDTIGGTPFKSPRKKILAKTSDDLEELVRSSKAGELKTVIRDCYWSLNDPVRSRLWLLLASRHSSGNLEEQGSLEEMYWDTVKQIFGSVKLPNSLQLPALTDQRHENTYNLTETGILAAKRVVNIVAFNSPDITYAPLLYPISCLLLHYLSEVDTYKCLTTLLSSRKILFFTQTNRHYEANWKTVMTLSKKFMKSVLVFISKNFEDQKATDRFFQNWIWFILEDLPFPYLVRVLDNYLFDGRKAIYRVWLALLKMFHRRLSSFSSSTSLEETFRKFCQDPQISPEKLIKQAYSIRGLKAVEIDQIFLKHEMYLKSNSKISIRPHFARSLSSDAIPPSQCQQTLQQNSKTITVREGRVSPVLNSSGIGTYPFQQLNSTCLSQEMFWSLWSWLPIRITVYQPTLLFTSEEHGYSLTTLFTKVENHSPTVIIIKTSMGEVFGAYCSSPWRKRNEKAAFGSKQGYFGTGETFVFTLLPEMNKYPWVGIEGSTSNDSKGTGLFMAADNYMLVIGGGNGQAIYIDADLRFGNTDTCLTFNNRPLCPTKDFEIQVIEVIGFVGCETP
ncbi:GTPase-activating protein skywalker-like isoform X2 [Artemia franciscana]|uniref:GTPase-activating protein skywalker-like isoform X2 n=1 Tax=Artemia franciscana TaxID=6661 RepID=UPI0032DB7F89